tara:strand:+ start:385 stop:726 length:342 start_codon:yes stop_codon:yes gene_type:complete
MFDGIANLDDPERLLLMQEAVESLPSTTLSLGTDSSSGLSLSLKILDGDATQQLLSSCITLISHQASKLEKYEVLMKSLHDSDLGMIHTKARDPGSYFYLHFSQNSLTNINNR